MTRSNNPAKWWKSPVYWVKVLAISVLTTVIYVSFNHYDLSSVGRPIPEFELEILDGAPFTRADLEQRVTVLNFFATWCGPCRLEMPDLNRFAAKQDPSQVVLVGVSAGGGDRPKVREFVHANHVRFPIAMKGDKLFQDLEGNVLPTTVIVDTQGRVADVLTGATTEERLERSVEKVRKKK